MRKSIEELHARLNEDLAAMVGVAITQNERRMRAEERCRALEALLKERGWQGGKS